MTFDLRQWQKQALDILIEVAGLTQRPSAFNRARARILDITDPQSATLETIASALRELGVVALLQTAPDDGTPLESTSTVVILKDEYPEKRVLQAGTDAWLHIPTNSNGERPFVLIMGDVNSFLTSDASMPEHRGHELHSHDHPLETGSGHHGLGATKLKDVWPAMKRILRAEKKDIYIIIVYSVLSSVLGLAVPLSSQAIVNAVALGVFSQQLVVLCIVVFIAMFGTAVIAVFERYVIDMVQRRVFVSSAFDIIYRLPHFTHASVRSTYTPELVNRFFDVMTIQKSIGKFLLEGVNAVLVLLVGLLVLGIYHPFFLLYDILFIFFIPILVLVLGKGAIATAVEVSKKKYLTASWLEDVARNQLGIKLADATPFTFSRINEIATGYVEAKHKHYIVLARQIFGSFLFKGFATVGVLALGGILVLEQAISLGQLVAAEIIIILILGAMEKLINQFDLFYDLVAAVDKLSMIADQPLEDVGGVAVPHRKGGGEVAIHNVSFAYNHHDVLHGVSLTVKAGERISLVGASGAGKSTLAALILGLDAPSSGAIEVNGVDTRVADVKTLRSRVGYVFPESQILAGTILDNITLGRRVDTATLNWALQIARLTELIRELPLGIHTKISSSGESISYGARRRILFARAILGKPEILIIDEAFEGIEDSTKLAMLDDVMAHSDWTVINITHDPEVVHRTNIVHVLNEGHICETGSPSELRSRSGMFCTLFPHEDTRFGNGGTNVR